MSSRSFGAQGPSVPHLNTGEVSDLRRDVEAGFVALEAEVGDLTDLDTTHKADLVGALNELFVGGVIGDHADGGANKHDATEIDYERDDPSKKNIQAASDTVELALTDLDDAIGAISTLTTSTQASAVAAINEIDGQYQALIANNASDSTAAGADADEHVFDRDAILSANKLKARDILEIEALVEFTGTQAGNNGCDIKLKLTDGNSGVPQTLATVVMDDADQNDWVLIRARIQLRAAAGSSATVEVDKLLKGATTKTVTRTNGLTIDLTASQTASLTVQYDGVDAGNTATLRSLIMKAGHGAA